MKEKGKGFLKEFREFATRGNVMDMAIGVIIAGAFGKITTSFVSDIFMPFLGWLIGDIDLTMLNVVLREAVMSGGEVVEEAVVIGIGTFISTIIDFILIAFVVFLVIKAINKMRDRMSAKKEEEKAPAAPPEPTKEELLLTEIRDILKDKNA